MKTSKKQKFRTAKVNTIIIIAEIANATAWLLGAWLARGGLIVGAELLLMMVTGLAIGLVIWRWS